MIRNMEKVGGKNPYRNSRKKHSRKAKRKNEPRNKEDEEESWERNG